MESVTMALRQGIDAVRRARFHRPNQKVLSKLEATGDEDALLLAKAVRETLRNRRIEEERLLLLSNNAPLLSGNHGLPGPFDAGTTISKACKASMPRRSSEFLGSLVKVFSPKVGLELGTNVGISAAYIASAMPGGELVTLEASPYRIAQARNLHRVLGLSNVDYVQGLFAETLPTTLQGIDGIDFALIDGHHQYQPTLDYFDAIHPFMSPGAVVVFDDIRWSEGMKQAWSVLSTDIRFGVVVDFNRYGVCVLGKGTAQERIVDGPIRL